MPVEQALEQLLALAEAAPIQETENLPLAEAEGRVLATDLVASLDLPPWPNSAMDGYALRLADWQGQPLPVSQRIFAGHAPQPLQPGTCARIFTGAPVPAGADCVEMQENTQVLEDGQVRFVEALHAGQNIRPQGQETRKGEQVMNAGTRLGPIELGLAATWATPGSRWYARSKWRCCPPATNWSSPGCRWGPGKSTTAIVGYWSVGCSAWGARWSMPASCRMTWRRPAPAWPGWATST